MTRNAFNICQDCKHIKSCVLTNQKDKVWYCSDYDERITNNHSTNVPLQTISQTITSI